MQTKPRVCKPVSACVRLCKQSLILRDTYIQTDRQTDGETERERGGETERERQGLREKEKRERQRGEREAETGSKTCLELNILQFSFVKIYEFQNSLPAMI